MSVTTVKHSILYNGGIHIVDVVDNRNIMDLCLYKFNIPIELKDIVNKYCGEDCMSECMLYPLIVKNVRDICVFEFDNVYIDKMPPMNVTPIEFTCYIYRHFNVAFYKEPLNKCVIVYPELFYRCYLIQYPNTVIHEAPPSEFPRLPAILPTLNAYNYDDEPLSGEMSPYYYSEMSPYYYGEITP